MRVSIIPVDGTVRKGDIPYIGLDLNSCGIPADVHALQWEEYEANKGHIEFNSPLVPNQEIIELPTWADACLVKWQEEYNREHPTV
jgi:hypothetical protein